MNRTQAWMQHLSNLLVGGTGLVYFVMKHLLTSDDPFAVVNHPLQPAVQHLHVLVAPLLVFATGFIWARHAAPRMGRTGTRNWRSGITLMLGFAPMVASGYLLQISVDQPWRTIWLWTHLATSALWILGYAAHAVIPLLAVIRKWRGVAEPDGVERRAS